MAYPSARTTIGGRRSPPGLDEHRVPAVAAAGAVVPPSAGAGTWDSTCLPDDTWDGVAPDAPSPRLGHTAVWTGSVMIVWGGGDFQGLDTGGKYDPLIDTWTPTALTGAPHP